MSTSGDTAAHGSRTADLAARVDAAERALTIAAGRVAGPVVERVSAAIAGVRERLALGVDHTVVALVGGTGSGKSSLFNAVCGLEFADVGVRRPTTAQVTACVWGSAGDALLDWLGVDVDRRIQRESELDADAEAALRGLVLLDLPDHDSVESANRQVVDRLLPMVDLLVWVVDPQKYADDALHSGYLRRLAGHENAMVVVLNQMDTVPVEVRGRLQADVARLLTEDGLVGVRVQSASARTGQGVGDLRNLLAEVASRRSTAAVRAGAEVTDAATLLGGQVGPGEPGAADLPVTAAVDALAAAAGLAAVADAVQAVVRAGGHTQPAFGVVQLDTVELARTSWLATVGTELPARWQLALGDQVASTDDLRQAVDKQLATIGVATRRSRAATALTVTGAVAALIAVATGVLVWTGGAAPGWAAGGALPLGWGALALVVGSAALLVRRHDARRRAAAVRRDGRTALEEIVHALLVGPTVDVLAEHREVRELVAAAGRRQPPTGSPAVGASPA